MRLSQEWDVFGIGLNISVQGPQSCGNPRANDRQG
jgi:hypothetical protein